MKRGIDFEKMEAAFKRAAYKAVHGTREERSGRFLPGDRGYEFYIERSSQGDCAARRGGSVTAPTQKQAIEKSEKLGPKAAVLGERVRDTDVGGRDV